LDKRSIYEIKTDALVRSMFHGVLSGILPVYTVTEYQKSGGTWVGQMLAEYMDIPFPRNRFPVFSKSLLHGHLMHKPKMQNVICVFRDGRDAIVSSYFHMLFESDKNIKMLVDRCRSDLAFDDYYDVKKNLPTFIEYLFTEYHVKTMWRQNQFTWNEFVDAWWFNEGVVKVKYEDLITDCFSEVERMLTELLDAPVDKERLVKVIDDYSFEKQTKRKPGVEDTGSFLRKGQPGDWREKFSIKSAKVFDSYAGDQLIMLGYEKDKTWIEGLK